jgi:hypothetical protein
MTIQHVSDLTWDRLHAGHLPPALADQARQHAAGCPVCGARGAELEAAHRRFVASPPPLVAARRARRAWQVVVPALAVAAAAVLILRIGVDEPREATRTKGGFAVTAFAGRDRDAVPLGNGDPILPGDRLQLSYSAERAGHLAVLAIDGAGQVAVYFPAGETTTWAARAGYRIALPASTELDDVLGEERLWIVFCRQPQPLAPLVDALRDRGIAAEPPPACEVQRLWFDKRAHSAGGSR